VDPMNDLVAIAIAIACFAAIFAVWYGMERV
jgi:hypothetical protein